MDRLTAAYIKAWGRIQRELQDIAEHPEKWRRTRRLEQLEARILRDMDALDAAAKQWIVTNVPQFYAVGAQAATGPGIAAVFTMTDRQTIQQLSSDLFEDLLSATRNVRETTKNLIRGIVRDELLDSKIRGEREETAARIVTRYLNNRGIYAVRYRDGSRHGLDTYSRMAIRTKARTAQNLGTINQTANMGTQFVEIFDGPDCGLTFHEDPEIATGQVVELQVARNWPIAHPNCRRTFGPRPDVRSPHEAREVPSSVTPEQMRAQREADEARALVQARRSPARTLDRRAARLTR